MSTYHDDPHAARGERLSQHSYPVPLLRSVTALLAGLGLGGIGFGVVGLVVVGVWHGLPLLPMMAVFLAVLSAPLLQLTLLHPAITVYERGVWVKPLIWRGSWIEWDAITGTADHTLIQRVTDKYGQLKRDGRLIIVASGLPWFYRVVGGMAGLGWGTRAFGIATHAHTDYTALLNAIQRHKRRG